MKRWILAACMVIIFSASAALSAQDSSIDLKKDTEGKISFKLKDADIRSVLNLFGKQLGMNIIAGDDVKGNVTFAFTRVTPLEGLDAVLRVKGYEWTREGDTIIVTSQKMVKTFTLQFANAEEVETSIKLLLGSDDTVSVNKSYNQIVVKSSSDRMGSIIKAIEEIDVPQIQVLVEANIVEIKRGDAGHIGVNLSAVSGNDPNDMVKTREFVEGSATTGPPSIYAQVTSSNFEAYLSSALAQQTYSILASPNITTINHKEASILIGEKLGYMTSTTTTTGTTQQISFLETGTKLVLTPHVSGNGYIRMSIQPKVSEGSVSGGIPNENTTETKSEVLVKDGQTIVIGGLFKRKENMTETGVPVLMNLPFIGMLFRKTSISNENRELMIFIKPTILTADYQKVMTKNIKDFTERQKKTDSSLIH